MELKVDLRRTSASSGGKDSPACLVYGLFLSWEHHHQLIIRSRIRVRTQALNLLASGYSRQISPAGTRLLQMALADGKPYFLFICLVYTKRNFTFFQDILLFNTLLCPRAYTKSLFSLSQVTDPF